MSTLHLCAVEFIGGPFDGHIYLASFPPDELARMASLPVNQNMFRMLEGKPAGPKLPATSVAVYELENKDGVWRYRYLGSTSAKQCQLGSWLG